MSDAGTGVAVSQVGLAAGLVSWSVLYGDLASMRPLLLRSLPHLLRLQELAGVCVYVPLLVWHVCVCVRARSAQDGARLFLQKERGGHCCCCSGVAALVSCLHALR